MIDNLMKLGGALVQVTKEYPALAGVVGIYSMGVSTYLLRDVPNKIWNNVQRQFFTTLTVRSRDRVYYELLRWVSRKHMHKFVRSFSLGNGVWGAQDARFDVGYETIRFFHKGRLFKMTRSTAPRTTVMTDADETIFLTMLGRNRQALQDLCEEVMRKEEKVATHFSIYQWSSSDWKLVREQRKRSMDTLALPAVDKKRLIEYVKHLPEQRDWYLSNGIPWRAGLLLDGPPGTGKTSIIRALCSHFGMDLYMIDLSVMTDRSLREALVAVPENAIVAIEDIDAVGSISPRASSEDALKGLTLSLSGMLNAIDGQMSGEGYVLVATTNHPENLDPAIVRDGRFNLKMHVGYMTGETAAYYLNRMYGPGTMSPDSYVRPKLAPATLQRLVSDNRTDPKPVLEAITKPEVLDGKLAG